MLLGGMIICCSIPLMVECAKENRISAKEEEEAIKNGLIKLPTDSYIDKNYKDVVLMFKQAGFINVTAENAHDLITGWLSKEGTVKEVSINGKTSYSGKYAEKDAVIIVRYHGFAE